MKGYKYLHQGCLFAITEYLNKGIYNDGTIFTQHLIFKIADNFEKDANDMDCEVYVPTPSFRIINRKMKEEWKKRHTICQYCGKPK